VNDDVEEEGLRRWWRRRGCGAMEGFVPLLFLSPSTLSSLAISVESSGGSQAVGRRCGSAASLLPSLPSPPFSRAPLPPRFFVSISFLFFYLFYIYFIL